MIKGTQYDKRSDMVLGFFGALVVVFPILLAFGYISNTILIGKLYKEIGFLKNRVERLEYRTDPISELYDILGCPTNTKTQEQE